MNKHKFMEENKLTISGVSGGSVSIASYNKSDIFLPREAGVIIADNAVKSVVINGAAFTEDFKIDLLFTKVKSVCAPTWKLHVNPHYLVSSVFNQDVFNYKRSKYIKTCIHD